jgi:transposase
LKSARVTLPEEPPGGVTAGIDWSRDDHAVSVVDARGREISRHTVAHTAAGLRELVSILARTGAGEAAIERPDGPVTDALLDAGITVVVISPNQVKNLRGRYGSAGNKDDRFDAFVLADTLRTDRARLRPLIPDSPATVALRRTCRARKDLVSHRVAVANQLRAHLHNVFPGATGLFDEPGSPVSLAFLARSGTQDRADWLTPARLGKWLTGIGYSGRTDPAVLHARLAAAPRGLTGPDADAQAPITHALHAVLTTLTQQIRALAAQIATQLAAHADHHIFTSLPRAGTVRAARLLAEIGDCRARFPTPEALACLAGAAPSTRQSGKIRAVTFRWSCDKQLRDAVTDFAGDSRHASPWAADLYQRARTRGHDHPHAVRILARAWLFVIWHAGKTKPPTTPPATKPSSASSTKINRQRLDTGLLTGPRWLHQAAARVRQPVRCAPRTLPVDSGPDGDPRNV